MRGPIRHPRESGDPECLNGAHLLWRKKCKALFIGFDKLLSVMKCIFCKGDSSGSKSVEHIIPESLGNTEHVLPAGIVCDKCNNYFAKAIEGPVLSSGFFRNLRGRQQVLTKKGRYAPQDAFMFGGHVNFVAEPNNLSVIIDDKTIAERVIAQSLTKFSGHILIPFTGDWDERSLGRFICKIGIEALADLVRHLDDWQDAVIFHPNLELVRKHVREGNEPASWPVSYRKIYAENASKPGNFFSLEQVVHEYCVFSPRGSQNQSGVQVEPHIAACFFGYEFVANLTEPSTTSYERYLSEHKGVSPLYVDDTLPIDPQDGFF